MTTAMERVHHTPLVLSKTEQIEALEAAFAVGIRQRDLLEQYIKDRLKPSKHFYQVVGSDKPSLSKDGAELICLPHGYRANYEWVGGPKEPPPDDTPYQITLNCRLEKQGTFMGGGMGSASSHQTKRDGTRQPRQPDPGLRHNATIKMAQKSAYIAATLSATAASEFFTQDMEDSQEEPDKTQHWCGEHQINWFKRGRMRNFAHPIGDTGQWCNEPAVKPAEQSVEQSSRTPASDNALPILTETQLHATLENEGMSWAQFEIDVLKVAWATWLKRGGTPAAALARWSVYKKQHPSDAPATASAPAEVGADAETTLLP